MAYVQYQIVQLVKGIESDARSYHRDSWITSIYSHPGVDRKWKNR